MGEGNTAEHYMRQALALAEKALERGEFPIAARAGPHAGLGGDLDETGVK